MSTVVNKQTLEVRLSVNEPDYDTQEWLIAPDIPDAPKRHWKVVGDNLELKSPAERVIADVAYLDEYKENKNNSLEDEFTWALEARYPPNRQRLLITFLALAKSDGQTNRAAYIQPLLDWVIAGTTQLFAAQDAVSNANTTEFVDGVSQNINGWLASDPQVSIRTAGGING